MGELEVSMQASRGSEAERRKLGLEIVPFDDRTTTLGEVTLPVEAGRMTSEVISTAALLEVMERSLAFKETVMGWLDVCKEIEGAE